MQSTKRRTAPHDYYTPFGFAEGGHGTLWYLLMLDWALVVLLAPVVNMMGRDPLELLVRCLMVIAPVVLSSLVVKLYVQTEYHWRWIPFHAFIAISGLIWAF